MSPPLHLRASSPRWPVELTGIPHAPEELWVRGRVDLLGRTPRVAVVGTRSPTPYGELQAARLAGWLAEHGIVVVSGLARGIDAIAHRAALEAGGATVAVLGSGVDRPWPTGALTERMVREGCLVSEFAPGQGPRRHHFPWRNRLIAGLARAVVVVEAAQVSGSLVTARWALDQGREVLAIPGRVDHPMARGCHRLLRDGAALLERPEDLLPLFGLEPGPSEPSGPPASPVLRALTGETLTAEELAARLGRPLPELLGELVSLELDGRVVRAPGGLFRLSARASAAHR